MPPLWFLLLSISAIFSQGADICSGQESYVASQQPSILTLSSDATSSSCSTRIVASPGAGVTLQFQTTNVGCCDTVEVYDGPFELSMPLWIGSPGEPLPNFLVSTQSEVLIVWTKGTSASHSTWNLQFYEGARAMDVCSTWETTITANPTYLIRRPYASNECCSTLLTAPSGKHVAIEFRAFSASLSNLLTFHDGSTSEDATFWQTAGAFLDPNVYYSSSNNAVALWSSSTSASVGWIVQATAADLPSPSTSLSQAPSKSSSPSVSAAKPAFDEKFPSPGPTFEVPSGSPSESEDPSESTSPHGIPSGSPSESDDPSESSSPIGIPSGSPSESDDPSESSSPSPLLDGTNRKFIAQETHRNGFFAQAVCRRAASPFPSPSPSPPTFTATDYQFGEIGSVSEMSQQKRQALVESAIDGHVEDTSNYRLTFVKTLTAPAGPFNLPGGPTTVWIDSWGTDSIALAVVVCFDVRYDFHTLGVTYYETPVWGCLVDRIAKDGSLVNNFPLSWKVTVDSVIQSARLYTTNSGEGEDVAATGGQISNEVIAPGLYTNRVKVVHTSLILAFNSSTPVTTTETNSGSGSSNSGSNGGMWGLLGLAAIPVLLLGCCLCFYWFYYRNRESRERLTVDIRADTLYQRELSYVPPSPVGYFATDAMYPQPDYFV